MKLIFLTVLWTSGSAAR